MGVALASLGAFGATSQIESQVFNGESILSFSSNGKWMVSEADSEKSLIIHNLETGQKWGYYYDGTDFGTDYPAALGPCVSDDGVVVAEVGGIPSYWIDGEWTYLPGYRANSSGLVTAVVGGITPDGSMIVGSLGNGASIFDERLMTSPCIWYRQDDGSYGDPEWLPTQRDFFGQTAQYLNLTGVSANGNTIAASMTSGSGFWHIPFCYTRGEDGKWTIHELGIELINPTGMEIPRYPGDYNGPNPPNYEEYMTPDKLYDFYYVSGPQWIDELYAQGITDESEIALLELKYAAEFMEGEMREAYEALLKQFLDAYEPWFTAFEAYVAFLERLGASGVDFTMNNVLVSPDGKYIYSSASGNGFYPVRFDALTGEYQTYRGSSFRPTCITADNSILGWGSNGDPDSPQPAYIIPQGEGRAKTVTDYWLELGMQDNYDWMEENLYQSVVVSINASGAEQFEDRWSVGKPIATPDMSLMGFGTSTAYWQVHPEQSGLYFTYLLNTGLDAEADAPQESGVGILTAEETEGKAEYYTLQGVRVANPGKGIYVKVTGGKASKVII